MPPKQETGAEAQEAGANRWMLGDDLSGRHDLRDNAAATRSTAFLMQLSAAASFAVVLISMFRVLQVCHHCPSSSFGSYLVLPAKTLPCNEP